MCVGSHAPQMTQEEQLCGGHCRAPDHAKAKFVAAVVAVMVDVLEVVVVAAEVIVVLVLENAHSGHQTLTLDAAALPGVVGLQALGAFLLRGVADL